MSRVVTLASIALIALGCRAGGARLAAGIGAGEHVTSNPRALDLGIVARPRFDGGARLEMEVTARADDLPRRWVVQKTWAGEEEVARRVESVRARCDGVEVATTFEDLETHVGWTLPSRCAEVTFTYAIAAEPRGLAWGYEFDAQVDRALATAIAETALVLPDCPDETRARVLARFDLREMPDAEGVYSLGVGRPIETTTRAARHAYFAAGRFDRVDARVGALALETRFSASVRFDHRAAARDLAALGAAEESLFGDATPESLRVLVVGVSAPEPAPHGTSLTSSALLWVDADAPWTPRSARLAAHEMVHLYNGQIIRRAGKDEQTYWFSEGFTEFLTDEIMLRARVGSAAGWLEAIEGRLVAYYSHPRVNVPNDRADMRWQGDAASLPYLRGALVAAFVDRAIRRRTGGARSLDAFMRDLLARARRGGAPLSQQELLDAIEGEIGADAARTVRSVVVDGARMTLPEDAYGPCVQVVSAGTSATVRVAPGVLDLDSCLRN